VKHVPIRPPRDMCEEQVFARRWRELMEMPSGDEWSRGPLHTILIGYPYEVDQRAASVAASFITWLGTNVGKCFLDLGNKIRDNVPDAVYTAYLAAWGVQNSRRFGNNSNARQIEFLVRTQADMEKDFFPEVSVKDLEVLEQVALWLGLNEGQKFIRKCEDEIDRRKELENLQFHAAAGRTNTPAMRKLIDKFAITP
jgi:hypothetical protein